MNLHKTLVDRRDSRQPVEASSVSTKQSFMLKVTVENKVAEKHHLNRSCVSLWYTSCTPASKDF